MDVSGHGMNADDEACLHYVVDRSSSPVQMTPEREQQLLDEIAKRDQIIALLEQKINGASPDAYFPLFFAGVQFMKFSETAAERFATSTNLWQGKMLRMLKEDMNPFREYDNHFRK